MAIDRGMFNFQGVMNKFYGYEPGKDDTEGRAIKNSFMANMVQSGFDAQMAKDMAQQQSSIAKSNMTLAADLEARNTSSNMRQEFNYGMQSMGAQYEYQNKFANNQYNRDLGTLAAQGSQARQNIGASGAQDRLTSVVQGEQQRANTRIQTEASKDIARTQAGADIYGSKVAADASRYGSKQTADASKYGSKVTADATRYSAAQQAGATKYGADKQAQASMYGADKTLEGTKYNADATIRNTTETGKQQRETMATADYLEASKANRQSARSKTMARSF